MQDTPMPPPSKWNVSRILLVVGLWLLWCAAYLFAGRGNFAAPQQLPWTAGVLTIAFFFWFVIWSGVCRRPPKLELPWLDVALAGLPPLIASLLFLLKTSSRLRLAEPVAPFLLGLLAALLAITMLWVVYGRLPLLQRYCVGGVILVAAARLLIEIGKGSPSYVTAMWLGTGVFCFLTFLLWRLAALFGLRFVRESAQTKADAKPFAEENDNKPPLTLANLFTVIVAISVAAGFWQALTIHSINVERDHYGPDIVYRHRSLGAVCGLGAAALSMGILWLQVNGILRFTGIVLALFAIGACHRIHTLCYYQFSQEYWAPALYGYAALFLTVFLLILRLHGYRCRWHPTTAVLPIALPQFQMLASVSTIAISMVESKCAIGPITGIPFGALLAFAILMIFTPAIFVAARRIKQPAKDTLKLAATSLCFSVCLFVLLAMILRWPL